MAKFGEEASKEAAARFGIAPPSPLFGPTPETIEVWAGEHEGEMRVFVRVGSAGIMVIAADVAMGVATELTVVAGMVLGPEGFARESKKQIEHAQEHVARLRTDAEADADDKHRG